MTLQGTTYISTMSVEINSNPGNPSSITVSILNPEDTVIINQATPTKTATGEYQYTYNFASDAMPGQWTVRWFVEDVQADQIVTIEANTLPDSLIQLGMTFDLENENDSKGNPLNIPEGSTRNFTLEFTNLVDDEHTIPDEIYYKVTDVTTGNIITDFSETAIEPDSYLWRHVLTAAETAVIDQTAATEQRKVTFKVLYGTNQVETYEVTLTITNLLGILTEE